MLSRTLLAELWPLMSQRYVSLAVSARVLIVVLVHPATNTTNDVNKQSASDLLEALFRKAFPTSFTLRGDFPNLVSKTVVKFRCPACDLKLDA